LPPGTSTPLPCVTVVVVPFVVDMLTFPDGLAGPLGLAASKAFARATTISNPPPGTFDTY
jgi:hypothetical protein